MKNIIEISQLIKYCEYVLRVQQQGAHEISTNPSDIPEVSSKHLVSSIIYHLKAHKNKLDEDKRQGNLGVKSE